MKRIHWLSLVLIFLLSLFIRGYLPFDTIFGGGYIRFGGNDPWYNLRLVENTLHNFPHRIYFDAFTHLPHGTEVPFAPLFDYLIAVVIWIIGLGNPYAVLREEGIKTIFVWFPPVLGALCVFPTYLIGKSLWDRNAGLIAAIMIAVLPGQFLSRSLLGFVDHHIMEVLLSTISVLMFMLAIKTAKGHNLQLKTLKERDWASLKKPLTLSILTGIAFGAFYLSWRGAPMFMFILLVFGVVCFIFEHLRGGSTDYLSFAMVPAFLVSLLLVSPFLLMPSAGFAKFQAISLVIGVLVFLFLNVLSIFFKYRKLDVVGYPITVLGIGIVFLIALNILMPSLYNLLITNNLSIFFPHGGALTIQEVNPMGRPQIWSWFSTAFFVMFVGFGFIANNIRKHKRPEEILFLIWCLVMLFACFGQNRFAYYYAINVALLCGLASWKIIELASYEKHAKKIKGKSKKNKPKQTKTTLNKSLAAVACSLIFLIVILPPANISLNVAKHPGTIPSDWYDALVWMRDSTPDSGVDYYGIYETPPNGENYDYSESAYSIMSWWDYGHWITTIAHRVPFANPFQAGATIAAEYLIATDEVGANKILDELNSKYVITDFPIVDFMGAPTNPNPKYVMPVWTGKNPNPLYTMGVRLHYFDGSEVEIGNGEVISALQHYRLVYESQTFVIPYMLIDTNSGRTLRWNAYHSSYTDTASQMAYLYQGARVSDNENVIAQTPEFIKPMSFVKIFEYVEGREIEGNAPNGFVVKISTNITTNQGREFIYRQSIVSNGNYVFVVPYKGVYEVDINGSKEMILV